MTIFTLDFNKLSEAAEDDRFCVGCLQIRTDVPVNENLCYKCGGGKETLQ